MKKKIKKYICRGVIATLLFSSMPSQIMAETNIANTSDIVEAEDEDNSNGIIVDVSESNNTNKEAILLDTISSSEIEGAEKISDSQENQDMNIKSKEHVLENDRAGSSLDSEDITEAFTDPTFRGLIKMELGLSQDDSITKSACANKTELSFALFNCVQNINGIEYFTNLTSLNCHNFLLTSVDLSKFSNLQSLNLYGNKLTKLDVSGLSNLQSLDCARNKLTSLNVSGCLNLQSLDCSDRVDYMGDFCYGNNKLTSLDLSDCPNLESLDCSNNNLTSLDLSNCPNLKYLNCAGNDLTSLDLSGCPNLESLDYSDNINLINLDTRSCPNIQSLKCSDNNLRSLDLSSYPNLQSLDCSNNGFTNLDLINCPNIQYLECSYNRLTSLDVSNCPNLNCLYCVYTGIKSEDDIKRNHNIEKLALYYIQVDELDPDDITKTFTDNTFEELVRKNLGLGKDEPITKSACAKITELDLSFSNIRYMNGIEYFKNLKALNLSGCSSLYRLNFSNNKLASLDVEGCSNLERLDCSDNSLTNLDVSSCSNLQKLYCSNNILTDLNAKGCSSLRILYCDTNDSMNLDVSNCSKLSELICGNNTIKNLDTRDCTNLRIFSFGRSNIINLNMSGCSNLSSLNLYEFCLKNLSVNDCTNLESLDCRHNNLTNLNVEGCPNLTKLDCSYNDIKSEDDVSGRTKDFDGENYIFHPQNNSSNVPTTPTNTPAQTPTMEPTTVPIQTPTVEPTVEPTQTSTPKPTLEPTQTPTPKPTQTPTIKPTVKPTQTPTAPSKPKKQQNLTVKPTSLTLYAGGQTKTLKVSKAKGKVTYKSSNPKVAKVTANGKVKPLSKGKVTITVTAAGNTTYKPATVKVKVTIYGKPVQVKSVKAVPEKEKPTLKVSWKEVPSASGYIIRYSYKKNMKGSKTIQIKKSNTTSKTIQNLTSGKYVYIQVQAYKKDGSIQIKGAWSKKVKSNGKIEKKPTVSENTVTP